MLLKWLRSNQGKVVVGGLVVGLSTSAGFAQMSIHTFFLDKYCSFMQMYRSGFSVPVPTEVIQMADEVFLDLKLIERDVRVMKFFTVVGLDTFSAGSTKLRSGAIIGIPHNLGYNREEDVETSLLKVNNKDEFDRTSATGQVLLSSLVLSNAAKKFAIAREVYSCTTYRNTITSLSTSSMLFFGYALGTYLNNRFHFQTTLPLAIRASAFSICAAISITMCLMVNDTVHVFYDSKADAAAARLGREYAVGGVEYYEKQVARNKALREVLGEDGGKYYTAGGNFNSWIRTPSLPPVTRLSNLRLELKKYLEQDVE